MGPEDWMGDGPQIQNFVVGEAGNIVAGCHIGRCLPPPVEQGQDQLEDEDMASQQESRDLAHRVLAIRATA